MDCILKVIRGPQTGISAKLARGETIVGKSSRAALKLDSPDVSVEHVAITNVNDEYYLENLSAKGTYLNETKVSGRVRLRLRDQIRVSADTVLRLESESGDSLFARHRTLFVTLVAVVVAIVVAVFIADPFTTPPPPEDWNHAYLVLEKYVEKRVSDSKAPYPQAMSSLFREAWRHQISADYRTSREHWFKLHGLLVSLEPPDRLADSAENRHIFSRLLRSTSDDPLPDEEAAVALGQMVIRCERAAVDRYNKTKGAFE